MSGPETANLSLLIGFLYLMTCAQFLTIDFFWPALLVNLSLVLLQITLFWLAIRNSFKAIKEIRREQQIIYEMNFRPLMESVTLKFQMMRQYVLIIILYFFYKISVRGSYDLRTIGQMGTKDTRLQRALMDEITEQNQWVDMALIICLLITYRPRMWPRFFEVGR